MSETTPRREATRQRLLQAAMGEFARHGIDATSVEQISEAAGFTRGAFYSNFEDKDALILALLEETHRATMGRFQVDVANLPEGPVDRISLARIALRACFVKRRAALFFQVHSGEVVTGDEMARHFRDPSAAPLGEGTWFVGFPDYEADYAGRVVRRLERRCSRRSGPRRRGPRDRSGAPGTSRPARRWRS